MKDAARLVTITDQKAVTTSLIVAEAFERKHMHVLRAIRELECSEEFNQSNFGLISYLDDRNRPQPAYQITRDGFAFLAMGFTGKRAAEFKERFIAAFNQMEQALLEGQGETKRVEVGYFRGTAAPLGLDIRYTLDLTKLCLRPTGQGVRLLSRLTGIDMDDIASELQSSAEGASESLVSPLAARFARERLAFAPGAWTAIGDIYADYCAFCAENDSRPQAVGQFGRMLHQIFPGILRKRSSEGSRPWGYENLASSPPDPS